jgi:hypothetical protein
MPISRMQEPRQMYGLGSLVKKAVKGVTGAVKDIASSDIGKVALLAAGTYGLGGGFGPGGFKFTNLPGAGLFARGPANVGPKYALDGFSKALSFGPKYSLDGFSAIGQAAGTKGIMDIAKTGAKLLTGSALLTQLFGSPLEAQRAYQQDPAIVKQYIRQYYQNINHDATEEEIEAFALSQLGEYAAKQELATGGRVGLEEGGIGSLPAGLRMNTTTSNPIPEDAPNIAADEIAKVIMGTLGSDEDMSSRTFIFEKYVMPKRKELMENYDLTLEEADNLIREGMDKYRSKKADGGVPTGIMRTNQAGVMERDYREEGGFVPVGIKEKADDVPAMLSKNEFVMTADAVRGAGNGDVEKGAQRMYKVMKTLENGGTV